MGYSDSVLFCHKFHNFARFFLFFLILSSTQVKFKAQGRTEPKEPSFTKRENEEREMLRRQIGSRPPRCERMCNSCGHCEAIQVPTNPQVQNKIRNSSTKVFDVVGFVRSDDTSNYKPMSWKCKCGKFIFNP